MNPTKQERLTAFLDQTITAWPRMVSPYWVNELNWAGELNGLWSSWETHPFQQPRPTTEQLANKLLGLAEFRALQLGAWLTTPDGELIAQAVEAMTPPLYRADVELLVDALQMAAQMQQAQGQKRVGRTLVGALSLGALALLARG